MALADQGEGFLGDGREPAGLDLPPPFSSVRLHDAPDVFAQACRLAENDRPGTLLWAEGASLLAFAVVLAPEEPLRSARRAFFAAMNALAAALGSCAPPQKAVGFEWPDVVRFDGGRIGGGRLGWPQACGEDAVPDWLVFAASLIVSKRHGGDPGLTPESTSLEEEGFAAADCAGHMIATFARRLLEQFDLWAEGSFDPIAATYLRLLAHNPPGRRSIDRNGDCFVERPSGVPDRLPLVPALQRCAWLDPQTGAPRL